MKVRNANRRTITTFLVDAGVDHYRDEDGTVDNEALLKDARNYLATQSKAGEIEIPELDL